MANKKILVDLDWFLDMRLSMYDLMNNAHGVIHLHDKSWFERDTDKIIRTDLNISPDKYRELYRDNYIELMKSSMATSFIYGLIARMNTMREIDRPGDKSNTYELHIATPYSNEPLANEDRENILEVLKSILVGYFEDITIVNYSAERISPEFIYRNGYSEYYCYHWSDWLKLHQDNLVELVSPMVLYYFPELKTIDDYDYDMDKNKKKYEAIIGDGDIFGLVSLMMGGIININWVPVIEVCAHIPADE